MLNCLNIDCDTDFLVLGINIGDWTCLWFDFLNEQEWDKCNLWCSGASVIECRNYSQITFIHISRDYPMNFWWPTFLDIFGFNVYVRYKDMDTYFPMKALIIFLSCRKLTQTFFLKPCVLIKILICWVMYSIYSEHCVNGQPSLFANNKGSLVLSWTAMGWLCKPNPLVTIARRPLRTNTLLLKIWLSIIES